MGEDSLNTILALPPSLFEVPERLIRPDWAGHLPFLACLFGRNSLWNSVSSTATHTATPAR